MMISMSNMPTVGVAEAARALPDGSGHSISGQNIRRMIRAGTIKAVRLPPRGRWRIPVSEVERLCVILAGAKP
jgi:excisionase family DNA binding protein